MNFSIPVFSAALLAAASLLLGGCAAQRAVTKAQPTAFLASTGKADAGKIGRMPFERSWRAPGLNTAGYSHIVLRPVSLKYLRTAQWSESASPFVTSEGEFTARAAKVAGQWNQSLRQAFASPSNRFKLGGSASAPGTLVVEIAMTEIVFSRPMANVASYAVMGGGVASAALFSPVVAFEARVLDGATGKVVATASDRRTSSLKLIDLNKFTYDQENVAICRTWSQEIMEAFNRELFPQVKRTMFSVY